MGNAKIPAFPPGSIGWTGGGWSRRLHDLEPVRELYPVALKRGNESTTGGLPL